MADPEAIPAPLPVPGDAPELAAESIPPTDETIAPETALAWLVSIRPAALLKLLREPDFAMISLRAFAGFRVNAASVSGGIVRQRLVQQIGENEPFASGVRALADEAASAEDIAKRTASSTPVTNKPSRQESPITRNREAEWHEQRERLRKERDEARQTARMTEKARLEADAAKQQAETALAETTQKNQQQAQRINRLERQIARMQTERTALLKALRQDKVTAPHRPAAVHAHSADSPEIPVPAPWRDAVVRLLHKDKPDTALALALDVLRGQPDNVHALDIAAQAYASKRMPHEAARMLRSLLAIQLSQGDVTDASHTVLRLLPLLPLPPNARRDIRPWLFALRARGMTTLGRDTLDRLRRIAPEACAWLEGEVRAAIPQMADELMPSPGALGPDDPLPMPGAWSARRLIAAVNTNSEALVSSAREALARLETDVAARVWTALAAAADGDDCALAPLRRAPRGPVVVDGSNAAWFDQQSYTKPHARLQPLLELRRTLRRRGYFPALLFADAPLPYTIDDPVALRAMLDNGEIAVVDSGIDADEVLLREAKRWNAPLVTNDYMADWDPNHDVPKIRYTISLNGEAHLDL